MSCHTRLFLVKKIENASRGINLHIVLTNIFIIDGFKKVLFSTNLLLVINFPGVAENIVSKRK
jgi:hypothetical protein